MNQGDGLLTLLEGVRLGMGEPGIGSRASLQAALVNFIETAVFTIGASPQLLALIFVRPENQPDLPPALNDTTARRALNSLAERLNLARKLVSDRSLATSVQVIAGHPMFEEVRPSISVMVTDSQHDVSNAMMGGGVSQVKRTQIVDGKATETIIIVETRRSTVELVIWASTLEAATVLEDVLNAVLMLRSESARVLGILEFTSHDVTGLAPDPDMQQQGRINLPLSLTTLSVLWENRLSIQNGPVLPRYTSATPRAIN